MGIFFTTLSVIISMNMAWAENFSGSATEVYNSDILSFRTIHSDLGNPNRGVLHIDRTNERIVLKLWNSTSTDGLSRSAGPHSYNRIEAQIVKVFIDNCKSIIYAGLVDVSPTNAIEEIIKVGDSRYSICPSTAPHNTSIEYTSKMSEDEDDILHSRYYGTDLTP